MNRLDKLSLIATKDLAIARATSKNAATSCSRGSCTLASTSGHAIRSRA
jgi:hypothetical protein